MTTIMIPTEDQGEVVDARRIKLLAGVGGALFLVMVIFFWALWPSQNKPRPQGTPMASATGVSPGIQPENQDPLEFVAAAKPPLVQRSPRPETDGPEHPSDSGTPTTEPTEDPTAWSKADNVTVYSKHGLNQPVVRTLAQGERVLWVKDYQNWSQVRLLGKGEGWVESKNLVFTQPSFARNQTPEEARQVLADFYAEVGRKEYAVAYERLSADWQAELPFKDFVKGFSQVRSLDVQLGETEVTSGVSVRQHVVIDADEEARPRRFRGTYTLEYHPIEWKLTSGILEEGGPPTSSAPGL
ncbi:SH3 domain-containing protein [bacterium CPR1]|nr:SH3 domain-containing protein [bacterium CPR1]